MTRPTVRPARAVLPVLAALAGLAPASADARAHRHPTAAHRLSRATWGTGDAAVERLNQAQLDLASRGPVPAPSRPAPPAILATEASPDRRPIVDFVPPFGTAPRPAR